jgi:predicted DNA-binding transcriptional regulator AlpA
MRRVSEEEMSMEPGLTFTAAEFCRLARISRAGFYKLRKHGDGPRVIQLGRRVYVSQESAREWIRGLEILSHDERRAK